MAKTATTSTTAPVAMIDGLTRADWLDQVAKAIDAAAAAPRFPGDPSPVPLLLDRLITRLYSECHNGHAIGTDSCSTCRAYRTERAETDLVTIRRQLDHTNVYLRDARAEAALAVTRIDALRIAGEQATAVANARSGQIRSLDQFLATAISERDGALAEAGELRKHVATLTTQLTSRDEEARAAEGELERLQSLARQMV